MLQSSEPLCAENIFFFFCLRLCSTFANRVETYFGVLCWKNIRCERSLNIENLKPEEKRHILKLLALSRNSYFDFPIDGKGFWACQEKETKFQLTYQNFIFLFLYARFEEAFLSSSARACFHCVSSTVQVPFPRRANKQKVSWPFSFGSKEGKDGSKDRKKDRIFMEGLLCARHHHVWWARTLWNVI